MRKKLDEVEKDLVVQRQVVSALQDKNKEKKASLNMTNKQNLQLSYQIEELQE